MSKHSDKVFVEMQLKRYELNLLIATCNNYLELDASTELTWQRWLLTFIFLQVIYTWKSTIKKGLKLSKTETKLE